MALGLNHESSPQSKKIATATPLVGRRTTSPKRRLPGALTGCVGLIGPAYLVLVYLGPTNDE